MAFLVHASCVAFGGAFGGTFGDCAVLLAGPPGCGKSDLALRLIDGGARLVADDQTYLYVQDGALYAAPPQNIAGLIEARHVGILRLPFVADVRVGLYIDLTSLEEALDRLPEGDTILLLDRPVRRLRLPGFAASTAAKIRAALAYPDVTDHATEKDEKENDAHARRSNTDDPAR